MKNLKLAAVLLCATAMAPTTSYAGDLSVSTGVDYVSEYVFRGTSFAGASVQPYAEASVGNFTVGGWFSTAIGELSSEAGDEFDLYVGYSVPLDSSISLDLGATYYHFPDAGSFFATDDGAAGTYEVSASLGFGEVPLAPSVTAYYDFTLDAFTLEGSVGHSFEVGPQQSFDLGLTAGLVEGDYEWATASASLGHSFTDDVSAYIGVNYSISSEDTLDFGEFTTLVAELDEDGVAVLDADGEAVFLEETNFGATDDNKFWVGVGISAGF